MMVKKFLAIVAAVLFSFSFAPIAHAAIERSDWVVNEIYQFNHPFAAQLPQELKTKMEKMSLNPFAFYRGTAHIFYQDMKTLPSSAFVNDKTVSWLQGDLHLQNLGAMQDSKGNHIFDTNDFDEGYLGPYVWDLRRMAVSIILAAKENGLSSNDAQDIISNFLDAYLDKMSDFKGTDDELSYRLESGNTSGVVQDLIKESAEKKSSKVLKKLTEINSNGQRVFQTNERLQSVDSSTYTAISGAMQDYINSIASKKRYQDSYYNLKDIRLRLGSGTGSLGRYRYYLLIEGPSLDNDDDRILEMKQETSSAVAIAAPDLLPSSYYGNHQGSRVTIATKAILSNTDPLLGYTTVNNIPFMLRENSPYDVGFDYTLLNDKSKFRDAVSYAGKIIAKDHAISDKDYDPNLIPYSIDKQVTDIVSGKKGKFKDEIIQFSLDYATQVEYDYNSFVNAYKQGIPLY